MGDHNHLAIGFCPDEQGHELLKDGLRVQILLLLVNDQRASIVIVQGEIEEKKHNPARARRQFSNIKAVIFDAIADIDVVCAEESLGRALVNRKRVYRVMRIHGLLLLRHAGGADERRHDGKIAIAQSNLRWCSDGFEITCANAEKVRVAFALGLLRPHGRRPCRDD